MPPHAGCALRRHDRRAGAPRAAPTPSATPASIRPSSTRALLAGHALGLDHTGACGRTATRSLGDDERARWLRSPRGGSPANRSRASSASRNSGACRLRLNDATLVPRPETETVVEAALAAIDRDGPRTRALRIADLGTGSGALLLALLTSCRTRPASAPTSAARRSRPRATTPAASALPRARAFAACDFGAALAGALRPRGQQSALCRERRHRGAARPRSGTIRAARSTAAPTGSTAIAPLRDRRRAAQARRPSGGRARHRSGTGRCGTVPRGGPCVPSPARADLAGIPRALACACCHNDAMTYEHCG